MVRTEIFLRVGQSEEAPTIQMLTAKKPAKIAVSGSLTNC